MRRAIPWPMRPRPMKPTFMASDQLSFHPLKLASDVVDDVAGLEVIGQHIPRVGLDLEMGRQRRLLVDGECLLEGEARGAEGSAEIIEEDRNVEMRAPLARARVLVERLERVLEVEEPGRLAVLLLTGLRQIDRL